MKEAERIDYIFGNHPENLVVNRFGWLQDSLLADIRTFIDGVRAFLSNPNRVTERPRGGGNLSIPILICTSLELTSALYNGKTKSKDGNAYCAENNVKKFMVNFIPSPAALIYKLLWDGIRNGLDHLFYPKYMKFTKNEVQFKFYIRPENKPSHASLHGSIILISVNSIEFYQVMEKAMEKYRIELGTSEDLQNKFIDAWQSIENGLDVTDTEKKQQVEYLLNQLKTHDSLPLF